MTRQGRWALASGLLVALLASSSMARAQTPHPSRGHTSIVNLQPPPAAAAFIADRRSNLAHQIRPGGTIQLSDERTHTLWANAAYRGPVYARPAGDRRVGRLHWWTEDGFPEVYVLLNEYVNRHGYAWIHVRIPGRPNGQTGWVRRSALGPFAVSRWRLVVDRQAQRLTAYHNGRRVFVAPVGVGKPSTPTPSGHFWIRERFAVSDPSSPYWPYALGTSDYSSLSEWPGGGVVGIHGEWGQPWLIPGDPSHGCIRMHNADIAWLAPRVTVGTPLDVI